MYAAVCAVTRKLVFGWLARALFLLEPRAWPMSSGCVKYVTV
jgi:hypothetical protein